MRKLVLFEHVSLDGMACGPGSAMDWIHVDEEIFDYIGEKAHQAGAGLYGRHTYEMMQSYWPAAGMQPNASLHDKEHSAWYNRVEKIVISRSMQGQHPDKTRIISDNMEEQVGRLKKEEGRDIVMFGSPATAQALMQHHLIDEFWLFINPVLLGAGTPLFTGLTDKVWLDRVASRAFASGVTCLHYELRKDA